MNQKTNAGMNLDWLSIARKHGYSFPCGRMEAFANELIAIGAAARPVANKGEVDEELRDYWMDKGFLQWVHDRLRFVHKENGNVDYMHKLRSIIESFPDDRKTPNVPSIATPPATTGASTVLTDERSQFEAWLQKEGRIRESVLGHGKVFIDADKAEIPWRAWKAAREVAAQAGQVAVPERERQSILQSVTNCKHSIESKCVKLYADPKAEGNALSQLVDRIMAAAPSPAKESK